MKANYGKKKGGLPNIKATYTTIPNSSTKQQNIKMKTNPKKTQRVVSKKGRT